MEFLGAVSGATGSLLWGYLLPFLFVLTVVVFVHELGHFLVGRWCGVGVKAFSIGFGPELVGWNDRHGTRWKISAIPLGGYVRFAGDLNAAGVPNTAELRSMTPQERAVSFPHQSVSKRAAIVAAGPIAYFLFAIAIYAGFFYVNGRQVLPPQVEAIEAGSPAERAGFQPEDLILSINGGPIESFGDVQRWVSTRSGEALTVVVRRGEEN